MNKKLETLDLETRALELGAEKATDSLWFIKGDILKQLFSEAIEYVIGDSFEYAPSDDYDATYIHGYNDALEEQRKRKAELLGEGGK